MKSCLQVKNTYFVKVGRIPLYSLNELGEKSRTTIILGNKHARSTDKFGKIQSVRKIFRQKYGLFIQSKFLYIISSFNEKRINTAED